MAHAIHGYSGACKNIHGHSYELHVTVCPAIEGTDYIPVPGFLIDFKEIKKLVSEAIIKKFDHQLVLSERYTEMNKKLMATDNRFVFEAEPTAENLLIFIRNTLKKQLPENIKLVHLKLFETRDSYAEWVADDTNKV